MFDQYKEIMDFVRSVPKRQYVSAIGISLFLFLMITMRNQLSKWVCLYLEMRRLNLNLNSSKPRSQIRSQTQSKTLPSTKKYKDNTFYLGALQVNNVFYGSIA